MSDYHVLEMSEAGDRATVAFHIPVPASGQNEAGTPWRTAVAEYEEYQYATGRPYQWTRVPDIDDPAAHGFTTGAVFEKVDVVTFSAHAPPLTKRAAVDTKFNELKDLLLEQRQNMLEFWGYERDVPV